MSRWERAGLLLVGGLYALSGLALLLAPSWFFENVGTFPPFNRHYAGDAGSFLLPWGVGLLLVARAAVRQRLVVGLAALASALHAANHLYDDWHAFTDASHFLVDTLPLLAAALLLGWLWLRLGGEERGSAELRVRDAQ